MPTKHTKVHEIGCFAYIKIVAKVQKTPRQKQIKRGKILWHQKGQNIMY